MRRRGPRRRSAALDGGRSPLAPFAETPAASMRTVDGCRTTWGRPSGPAVAVVSRGGSMITPSLASRPFLNTRPVWMMTIAAGCLALVLMVLNIRFFLITNRAVEDEIATRDALEERYGELEDDGSAGDRLLEQGAVADARGAGQRHQPGAPGTRLFVVADARRHRARDAVRRSTDPDQPVGRARGRDADVRGGGAKPRRHARFHRQSGGGSALRRAVAGE